jgi:hypothetical protein
MTLTDLLGKVQQLCRQAEEAGHDPDNLPVIGLNMNGEYRHDYIGLGLRLEASDPDDHFNDSEWAPGPCAIVQSVH